MLSVLPSFSLTPSVSLRRKYLNSEFTEYTFAPALMVMFILFWM